MPKGKKFDAAEKHFIEKESKYQKQIKHLLSDIFDLRVRLQIASSKNQELSSKNVQLQEWIERLLEYTELDIGDIKTACEQDKQKGEVLNSLSRIFRMGMEGY